MTKSYRDGLIEIAKRVAASQSDSDVREMWIHYLLGYISALDELEVKEEDGDNN